MQLSAPALPFDPSSAVPTSPALAGLPANTPAAAPAAPATFSAMLTDSAAPARSAAAPKSPSHAPLTTCRPVGIIPRRASSPLTDDPAVQQEALAEWMASNGSAPAPVNPSATLLIPPTATDGLASNSVTPGGIKSPVNGEAPAGITTDLSPVAQEVFSQAKGASSARLFRYPQSAHNSAAPTMRDAKRAIPLRSVQAMIADHAKSENTQDGMPVDSTSIADRDAKLIRSEPGSIQIQPTEVSASFAGPGAIATAGNAISQSETKPVESASSTPVIAGTAPVMGTARIDLRGPSSENAVIKPELADSPAPRPAEGQMPASNPSPISSVALDTIAVPTTPAVPDGDPNSKVPGAGAPLAASLLAVHDPSASTNAPELSSASGMATEKIAGPLDRLIARFVSPTKGEQKNMLFSDKEKVGGHSSDLGINVAKAEILMPPSAPTSVFPTDVAEHSSVSATPLVFDPVAKETAPQPSPQTVPSASHAVESALAAAENITTGERHSVNLQFSVSGVDLAVKVDLRGDVVHTEFRTDSPELRVALEREWQSVTAETGDRSQRLADPVFTSATSGNSTHSDSTATDQRGSNARQGQFPQPEFAGARTPRRNETAAAPEARSARAEPLSTVRRLHAFA